MIGLEQRRHEARMEKIARLHGGAKPRVLDLFAGCGGISLGFQRAGFEIVASVEADPLAAQSHALNFFQAADPAHLELHSCARDITATEPEELVSEFGLGGTETAIDVIVGGPPCQAFARVGRAKLREVAEHPDAFRQDPRANLYLRYIHYVSALQPLAILVENVPDVLNFGGHNVPEEISEVLSELGYRCKYTLLNAAYYGVPQMRERMFLLAYADELGADVEFPAATHWCKLPRGYEGTRAVALKGVTGDLMEEPSRYYTSTGASASLPPAVSAKEALGDLPPITAHLEGKLTRGTRRFTELSPYRSDVQLQGYAKLMRTWPGYESTEGVYDHVIRSLPRDYNIFRRMNPGDQYPEAYHHAHTLFAEILKERALKGQPVDSESPEFLRLKKTTVPPYDPTKFPNKWRKLEPDAPSRTLMAHLGKDSYSHIHYDSDQARTISVREAARLQSFPDGFVFSGTMNPAFRQIGNAVPPLLAASIGAKILQTITSQPPVLLHTK